MNLCKNRSSRRCREAAFTLVEILFSGAVLGMAVVSLYAGISFGFTNINLARQNLRATQLALEKMETIRTYDWDQVNSNSFVPLNFTAPFFPPTGSEEANAGFTFYGTTTITAAGAVGPYSNEMRRVDVRIVWTNRNASHAIEMSTYLAEYGLQRQIH